MKRTLFGLGLPLLLVGLIVICLGALAQSTADAQADLSGPRDIGDPVTIELWHPYTGDREAHLQGLVDEFNDSNPYSITVTAEYGGSYGGIRDGVLLGLQGGEPLPNAVVGYPNSFADYARFGAVRFLDDYLNDPVLGISDTADLHPGILDDYRLEQYGNQLAGLQFGRAIEVMYYNADLLITAGITIPATWEDFRSDCITLTTSTVTGTIPGTDASRFATWLWSRGGEVLSEDGGYARFQEQPGIDSLLLFQQLIDGGYAGTTDAAYGNLTQFCNGQVGFTFGSSSVIPYYQSAMAAGAGNDWGVTHVPAMPGHEVVDSYGGGIGILQASEDEDRAAWLFLRWMVERNQTARWAAMTGYFPVRISAATHPSITQKLASDEQWSQAFNLLPLGRTEPAVRGYETMRSIIGDAVYDIFHDSADVTATLETAALEVDALLGESGPQSGVIPPEGGTLIYSGTEGLGATIVFPPAAVPVTQTVTYVPLDDLPTDGLGFALLPNMSFSQPVTLTIQYRDADVAGMDEADLKLYTFDWSSQSWQDADPCGGYVRDPDNNILQALICHFSDYGLIDRPYRVYLPVIVRNLVP